MSNPVPLSLDVPYRFDQPLDMDDARHALRSVAEGRRQGREWLQRAILDLAEKERTYRKERARAWARVEGTAEQKKDEVGDLTADLRYARDIAVGVVKAAQERIEEVDAERASLHRLVEWSMRFNTVGEQVERPVSAIGGRA